MALWNPVWFPLREISSCSDVMLPHLSGQLHGQDNIARSEWFLGHNHMYRSIVSGYRRDRCAVDSIIYLVRTTQRQTSQTRPRAAVFLDINRAIDKVTQEAITTALEGIDHVGRLYSHISKYPTDRTIFISTSSGSAKDRALHHSRNSTGWCVKSHTFQHHTSWTH